jgi:hypothetical protein
MNASTKGLEIEVQLFDGIEWEGSEATVWRGVAYCTMKRGISKIMIKERTTLSPSFARGAKSEAKVTKFMFMVRCATIICFAYLSLDP